MGKIKDLVGQHFGRLTVLKYVGKSKWLCKCDCGNEKIILGSHLTRNLTKSCGCLNRESALKRKTTHGLSKTKIYAIYQDIKTRCYNKKEPSYKNYGGRGITICNEWNNDFISFYNWSMANGYKDDLTIDRINVNGNYEPNNCRWVNRKVQANNRRNNRFLEFNGEILTMKQWAEKLNINYFTLSTLLNRDKKDFVEIVKCYL